MPNIYRFVEENLRNGCIKQLFSWIEWVTLTGVVFAVGIKFNGLFLILAGILGFLLYFSALIGVAAFVSTYASKLHISKILVMPIAFVISTVASG